MKHEDKKDKFAELLISEFKKQVSSNKKVFEIIKRGNYFNLNHIKPMPTLFGLEILWEAERERMLCCQGSWASTAYDTVLIYFFIDNKGWSTRKTDFFMNALKMVSIDYEISGDSIDVNWYINDEEVKQYATNKLINFFKTSHSDYLAAIESEKREQLEAKEKEKLIQTNLLNTLKKQILAEKQRA